MSKPFSLTWLPALLLLSLSVQAADPDLEFGLLLGGGESLSNGVSAGPISSELKLDESRFIGVNLFYLPTPELALGVEFATDRADLDALNPLPVSGGLAVNSLMFNGEYRFGSGRFRPFLGLGLGGGSVAGNASAGAIGLSGDDNFFVAQAYGGARYQVSDTFSVQAQVRYRHADDADIKLADGLNIPLDYEKFLILVGANIQF